MRDEKNTGWRLSGKELIRRTRSEKAVQRDSLVILEGTEQTDEDLIESFEKARKAGEFKALDCERIYQRELRISAKDSYRASTQDLDALQQTLDELKSDLEVSDDFDEQTVHFSTVEIHEHPIIVGDNPGGKRGAPITIDWKAISDRSIDISRYEHARDGHRRGSKNMRMTAGHRQSVLRSLGFDVSDIEKAAHSASKVRSQRQATISRLHKMDSQERMEKARRFMGNLMSLGRKSREEKKFLAPYRMASAA